MERKKMGLVLGLVLTVVLLLWLGIGPVSSGSAVADLKGELESIYGAEYTGKEVETGTEDMVFVVEPKTWFLTNWNMRNLFSLDYEYECRVIYTTHTGEGTTLVRTVTYQAVDPMGEASMTERAHLDLTSKTETVAHK